MSKNFHQVSFLISAAQLHQLPEDLGSEVAFVGRSNVGKSSAINKITGQKQLAKTSKTPGRTQLINFFQVEDNKRLVDLPGYGYAKVAKSIQKRWQQTLDGYLKTRKSLKGLILLSDIRHPFKEFDLMMINWCKSSGLPLHILLTKADKLTRNHANRSLLEKKNELQNIHNLSLQCFSSQSGVGCDELEMRLNSWLER